MKKNVFIMIAAFSVLSLMFLACGGGDGGGSVEGIPRAFYAAMSKGNVDAMKKMTTGSFTAEAVRSAEQTKNVKMSISDFKVKGVKDVSPDKKTVRVEFVGKMEPKGRGFARKMRNDQIFHLKKVEGKWLIEKIAIASPPVSLT